MGTKFHSSAPVQSSGAELASQLRVEAHADGPKQAAESTRVHDTAPIKSIYAVEETPHLITDIKEALDRGDRVVMLVFGKRLRSDGTLDERGVRIVDELASLYNRIEKEMGGRMQNLAVLFTGGENSGYLISGAKLPSEASVMYKALLAKGVNPQNVFLEERSYDTVSNVLLSYPIAKSFGANTIVVFAEEHMAERALRIINEIFDESDAVMVKPVRVKLNPLDRLLANAKEWLAMHMLRLLIGVRRRQFDAYYDELSIASLRD